jgi:hypothetical protein
MISYHGVFVDETGCEFGATIRAATKAEAWEKARENYPESQCVQLESPAEASQREYETYLRALEEDEDYHHDDYDYEEDEE